jgi:hypothetical protein
MSRGPGYLQQYLRAEIGGRKKPITFSAIRARILRDLDHPEGPTFERSLRRALRGLVDAGVVMALGDGGRGDPHRYCINPLAAAIGGTEKQYARAQAALESDPGGNAAMGKMMQRMRG